MQVSDWGCPLNFHSSNNVLPPSSNRTDLVFPTVVCPDHQQDPDPSHLCPFASPNSRDNRSNILARTFSPANATNTNKLNQGEILWEQRVDIHSRKMDTLLPRSGHILSRCPSPHQSFLPTSIKQRDRSWGLGPLSHSAKKQNGFSQFPEKSFWHWHSSPGGILIYYAGRKLETNKGATWTPSEHWWRYILRHTPQAGMP